MELNWTTFVLEIVNFLVLVWLLQRLFYRPVREMIEKRRQGIEAQLQRSRDMQEKAEELMNQYESRLQDWETERQAARLRLDSEMEDERRRLLTLLHEEMTAERKKREVLAERKLKEHNEQSEMRALELGARFVACIFKDLSSLEVESRLIDLLLRQIGDMPGEQMNGLLSMAESGRQQTVQVVSAYPLDEPRRHELEKYLHNLLPSPLPCSFSVDRELLAGLCITVGPWIIHANLRDELRAFASVAQKP